MPKKPSQAEVPYESRRKRFWWPLVGVVLVVWVLWAVVGTSRRWVGSILPPPPAVEAVAKALSPGRPVLFVGLDGADWELLDPYATSGVMPNLARLLAEGRAGVLASIEPPLSPLVWTTMMTGVSPVEHGILDFTRFSPGSGDREPIGSEDRRLPAIWNMATQAGKRVAVFGLWATWPAEAVDGLMVADRLISAQMQGPAPPGAVYPPDQEAWVRSTLEKTDAAVDRAALLAYLPWLSEAAYTAALAEREPLAQPVSGLRRILVETRAIHALATEWLSHEETDLAVVYFQGTDLIGHLFAPFAPPRQASIREEDFNRYRNVPEQYFREIDRYLGEYMAMAEKRGAVLVLASDHGFQWREGRPTFLPSLAMATAGKWHRREGVSVLWGPGLEPGLRVEAQVDQITPTLLSLAGLPLASGASAEPLPGVTPSPRSVDYKRAYRPARRAEAAGAELDEAAVERLRALGYLGSSEPDHVDGAKLSAEASRTPGSFNNEGLILRGWGDRARAQAAFEQALALDPKHAASLLNLSELLFSSGQNADRSDRLLLGAVTAGTPQGAEQVVTRARAWREKGQMARGLALLDAAVESQPADATLRLWRGRYRMEQPDCPGALLDFVQATALAPLDAMAHASLGLARGCVGDTAGAKLALSKSLALDPNQPELVEFLATLDTSPPP